VSPERVDITNQQKLVAMATSLEESKSWFKFSISSHGSAKPENVAEIGPVNFEITGLTKIVEINR